MLKVFKMLDKNGDGVLSQEELIQGYTRLIGEEQAKKEVEQIMQNIDNNGNRMIDYSEWVTATINRQQVVRYEKLK